MARPTVLIIDPDQGRRHELSQGFAARGFEAVRSGTAEEGLRFAEALRPPVLMVPISLTGSGEGSLLDRFASLSSQENPVLTVLLGDQETSIEQLPDEVLYLPLDNLSLADLVDRISLVLVGTEVQVASDASMQALVGDLEMVPLLELIRSLGRAWITGRLEVDQGLVHLSRGKVISARSGTVKGIKAFCRLSRYNEGPFRVLLGPVTVPREIDLEMKNLVVAAIDDSLAPLPNPRSLLRIIAGPTLSSTQLNPLAQQILGAIKEDPTLGHVLDRVPETDGQVMEEIHHLEEDGLLLCQEPRALVQVLTDSTADLPQHLTHQYGIRVIPLNVHFGEQNFKDRVDLPTRQFYEMLEEKKNHPSSSPPSVETFAAAYSNQMGRSDQLSIHISAKMSKTLEHAQEAAVRLPAPPDNDQSQLITVDSRQVSLGLGLVTLMAARMASRGHSIDSILEKIDSVRDRVHTYFVPRTLEYLARGGRIGRARALLGSLLGITPILGLEGGEVVSVDRTRGTRTAHPRMIDLLGKKIDPRGPLIVAIGHAEAPVWADHIRRLLEQRFRVREVILGEMGPVVGTHVGPQAVGLAAFQPKEEELELFQA